MARYVLIAALGAGAALAWHFAAQTRTLLAAGLEALAGWSLLVGFVHMLYPRPIGASKSPLDEAAPAEETHDSWLAFPYAGQGLTLAFAVMLLLNFCGSAFRYPMALGNVPMEMLRLAAPVLLVYAVVLSFLARYARLLADDRPASFGEPIIQLARLVALASGVAAALVFLFLSTGWDFSVAFGATLAIATVVLMAESTARLVSRFFFAAFAAADARAIGKQRHSRSPRGFRARLACPCRRARNPARIEAIGTLDSPFPARSHPARPPRTGSPGMALHRPDRRAAREPRRTRHPGTVRRATAATGSSHHPALAAAANRDRSHGKRAGNIPRLRAGPERPAAVDREALCR